MLELDLKPLRLYFTAPALEKKVGSDSTTLPEAVHLICQPLPALNLALLKHFFAALTWDIGPSLTLICPDPPPRPAFAASAPIPTFLYSGSCR